MKLLLQTITLSALASATRIQIVVDQSNSEASHQIQAAPPVVTLPYEKHQAIVNVRHTRSQARTYTSNITLQDTGGYYNFSNIPYAQPPLGALRFAKPEAINHTSDQLNHGTIGRICPQVQPGWFASTLQFVFEWTLGRYNSDSVITRGIQNILKPDHGRMSEDCLLLDVVVPQKVWDNMNKRDFYRGIEHCFSVSSHALL